MNKVEWVLEHEIPIHDMNANLVLALLSKRPHPMYTELAVVSPVSPFIANLSYILKATFTIFIPLDY